MCAFLACGSNPLPSAIILNDMLVYKLIEILAKYPPNGL